MQRAEGRSGYITFPFFCLSKIIITISKPLGAVDGIKARKNIKNRIISKRTNLVIIKAYRNCLHFTKLISTQYMLNIYGTRHIPTQQSFN